jgi:U3 small nucleolar RNA-associated protein 12
LASGGTEGEIVVWDTVAEVGLFRLRGHRGPVTSIRFIPHPTLEVTSHPGYLVSSSKDTYLKLWDLSTQHCIQTVVVGRGEVTSCDAMEEAGEDGEGGDGRWIVITGSGDGEAKVWSIERVALIAGLEKDASGEVSKSFILRRIKLTGSYQHSSSRSATYPSLHPLKPLLKFNFTLINHSSCSKLQIVILPSSA